MTAQYDELVSEIDEAEAQRDEARAALALAVDSEHDAVKRAQELERELHEVRAHLVKSRAAVMEERDEAHAALRAFVEAWDKSLQLEKTDVALRMARAVLGKSQDATDD